MFFLEQKVDETNTLEDAWTQALWQERSRGILQLRQDTQDTRWPSLTPNRSGFVAKSTFRKADAAMVVCQMRYAEQRPFKCHVSAGSHRLKVICRNTTNQE